MRVKLQLIATFISVIGFICGAICKKMTPEYWTDGFIVSIALFWLMEMAISFLLNNFEKHINKPTLEGKRFMTQYMVAKGVKLLITIIYIIIGISLISNTESKAIGAFAVSAVVLYLLHLAGETFVITKNNER